MPKSPNYLKLRTNLRLSINRLKMLEKKKAELALKARREIADYISAGKDDRARIRVEHIIREDYMVEAMEIVEMFCDLLLARFGLIERMKEMDPGLEEAIATMFWVSPRLQTDVQEMKEITNQLTIKYGKEYAEMCRKNGFENVNEKVLVKMSLYAPPKLLIENYMVEIANAYNVPFVPDVAVMEESNPAVSNDLINLAEQAAAADIENMLNERKDPRGPGGPGVGGGSGGFGGGGGGGGGLSEPLPPFKPGSSATHPFEGVPPPYTPQDPHSSAPVPFRPLVGPDSQATIQRPTNSVPPPLPGTPPNAKKFSPDAKTFDQDGWEATGGVLPSGSEEGVYDYAALPVGPGMSTKILPSYNAATGHQTNPGYGLYTIGPDLPPRPSSNALNSAYSDVRLTGPTDPLCNSNTGAASHTGVSGTQSAVGGAMGPLGGACGTQYGAVGPQGGIVDPADVYVPVLPDIPRVPSVRADVQSGKHNTDYETFEPRTQGENPTANENIYIPVLPEVPNLPSVPSGSLSTNSVDDFDDLTKRFEALKKKK